MKYIKLWLNKKIPRSYQRSGLKGLPTEISLREAEKFINENRKRIQDLELIVKELAQKIAKLEGEYE